ncbi:MAG: fibrobacter succinogenes major paralogous domain-containing protein [Saprospiraceae bacterium]|nr:fibrobacter succinogenes major paralogous domain-containing protein [Saprospiraceae bacterium]
MNTSILNKHQLRIRNILSTLVCTFLLTSMKGQILSLFVDGGLRIGNTSVTEPEEGTIRWTGEHFEGFNGIFWTQLEGDFFLPRVVGPHVGSGEISEIDGAIQIGTNLNAQFGSSRTNPEAGTIRWSGSDFQGWNGVFWVSLSGNSLYDVDGNTYRTVVIGNQEWMQENLRTGKYLNGESISLVSDNSQWQGLNTGAYSLYEHEATEENVYGKLYNWYAVIDPRGLCPTGWRIPDSGDWTALVDFLGGASLAGGKLKETGLRHWNNPNTNATNESEFTGLAGGFRSFSGSFIFKGNSGSWWSTTTTIGTLDVYIQSLSYGSGITSSYYEDRRSGVSVRCIKK